MLLEWSSMVVLVVFFVFMVLLEDISCFPHGVPRLVA